jgi:hypothetical protein
MHEQQIQLYIEPQCYFWNIPTFVLSLLKAIAGNRQIIRKNNFVGTSQQQF